MRKKHTHGKIIKLNIIIKSKTCCNQFLGSNCARSTQNNQFPKTWSTSAKSKNLNNSTQSPQPPTPLKKIIFFLKRTKNKLHTSHTTKFPRSDLQFSNQQHPMPPRPPRKKNRIFRSKSKIAYKQPQFCSLHLRNSTKKTERVNKQSPPRNHDEIAPRNVRRKTQKKK